MKLYYKSIYVDICRYIFLSYIFLFQNSKISIMVGDRVLLELEASQLDLEANGAESKKLKINKQKTSRLMLKHN